MKRKVFSVYDVKAQTYANPFLFTHKGEAIRAFMTGATDKSTSLNKYPSDYKLYYLGEFDDQSGKLHSIPNPEYLNTASDFVHNELPITQLEESPHVQTSN